MDVQSSPAPAQPWVNLAKFQNAEYEPKRGILVRTLWHYCSLFFFESGWFPFYTLKTWLLRLFGANIGKGVVIKPNVRIKFPWRLSIGEFSWIGQEVWIDNLADVYIGSHACVSQNVYLCTGSHDRRRESFDLIIKPIVICDGAWVAAQSTVLPGVTIGANAIVAAGSIATRDVAPAAIVAGNPARPIAEREPPHG